MYCQHCGHKKIPDYPHACETDFKQGKIKKLEIHYCANCGEPIANKPYSHRCGTHQLRDYWLSQSA